MSARRINRRVCPTSRVYGFRDQVSRPEELILRQRDLSLRRITASYTYCIWCKHLLHVRWGSYLNSWTLGTLLYVLFSQLFLLSRRHLFLVPCLQLPSERESLTAALSLFVCGFIAAEKYSFISAPYVVFGSLCHLCWLLKFCQGVTKYL